MTESELTIDGRPVRQSRDLIPVYEQRLEQFGDTPRTVLYDRTPGNHPRKIAIYAGVIGGLLADRPELHFLDVGCGYGSLAEFVPPQNYTGVDLVPGLIRQARSGYPDHTFICAEIGELEITADIAVMVGATGCVPDPFELARQAWEASRVGLLVDFIAPERVKSDRVNPDTRVYPWEVVLARLKELGAVRLDRREFETYDLYYLSRREL